MFSCFKPVLLAGAMAFAISTLLAGCGGGSDGGSPPQPTLAPGSLDPSFGTNGIVTTPGITFTAQSIVLQPDGKIVAAGSKLTGDRPNVTASFVVVRYAANGSPDPTFGSGGVATTAFDAGDFPFPLPAGVIALQPNGKVLVGGVKFFLPATCVIARYNSDGTLDSTFGTSGKATLELGTTEGCSAFAVQSDGKIVVAGGAFAAMRLNADGSRDASFGMGGTVSFAQACFGFSHCSADTILVQSDGRLVLAGTYDHGLPAFFANTGGFALMRIDANGTIDPGFGNLGVVLGLESSFTNVDRYAGSAMQPDGKILIALDTQLHWIISRVNADGSVDATFQPDPGMAQQGRLAGFAITLQPNGKFVVVGTTLAPLHDLLVARFAASGLADPTFGSGGVLTTQFGVDTFGTAAIVQPDGRIVVAARTKVSGQDGLALVRYFGD